MHKIIIRHGMYNHEDAVMEREDEEDEDSDDTDGANLIDDLAYLLRPVD